MPCGAILVYLGIFLVYSYLVNLLTKCKATVKGWRAISTAKIRVPRITHIFMFFLATNEH